MRDRTKLKSFNTAYKLCISSSVSGVIAFGIYCTINSVQHKYTENH